jgi:AraC family transcriptional regulator
MLKIAAMRSQEFWSSGGPEVRLRDLVLTEVLYPAGLKMPSHRHAPAYLSCVLEGTYYETVGRTRRTVEGSSILAHPEEEEHAVEFGAAGARILSVRVGESTLALLREESASLGFERWQRSPESEWTVAKIRREMRHGGPGSRLALEGLALQLLASGLKSKLGRPSAKSVRKALDYISESYTLPLTLEAVALASGVHPTHLARAFRRHTGSTIGEYVRKLRVERARALIESNEMPLGQIAAECGFSDQPHLTRTFKQHTGLTPAKYREGFRKG